MNKYLNNYILFEQFIIVCTANRCFILTAPNTAQIRIQIQRFQKLRKWTNLPYMQNTLARIKCCGMYSLQTVVLLPIRGRSIFASLSSKMTNNNIRYSCWLDSTSIVGRSYKLLQPSMETL